MGSSRIARRVSWWIAVTLACADALSVAPAPAASQRVRRSAPPSRRALLAGAAAAATLAQLPRAAVAESKKAADGLEWTDVKVGDDVGKVARGDTATIDYAAWLGGFDGREFSRFEKPIKVTLGEGKIVKGLEAALSDGMRPGGVARVAILLRGGGAADGPRRRAGAGLAGADEEVVDAGPGLKRVGVEEQIVAMAESEPGRTRCEWRLRTAATKAARTAGSSAAASGFVGDGGGEGTGSSAKVAPPSDGRGAAADGFEPPTVWAAERPRCDGQSAVASR
ncbi:hypothetical protein JL720_11440 [Aureococcus anophagefferens]|nr:hypothetical protein JL720_11440 [Aureococcus anophagefferens]